MCSKDADKMENWMLAQTSPSEYFRSLGYVTCLMIMRLGGACHLVPGYDILQWGNTMKIIIVAPLWPSGSGHSSLALWMTRHLTAVGSSQVLLAIGQVVFLRDLLFSPHLTIDSAQTWPAIKPKEKYNYRSPEAVLIHDMTKKSWKEKGIWNTHRILRKLTHRLDPPQHHPPPKYFVCFWFQPGKN